VMMELRGLLDFPEIKEPQGPKRFARDNGVAGLKDFTRSVGVAGIIEVCPPQRRVTGSKDWISPATKEKYVQHFKWAINSVIFKTTKTMSVILNKQ